MSKILKFWPLLIIILIWSFLGLNESSYSGAASFFSKIKTQISSPADLKPEIVIPKVVENTLVFGGDIMLSRGVNSKMEKYKDYSWPLKEIAPLFGEADLAIANLESPFLISSNYQVPSGSFSFKANPLSVEGLSLAGFDVLSLANNHALNQGKIGLNDTYTVLDKAGISYVGTTAHNLVIKESQGVKFAFLSYTYSDDSSLIANMLNFSQTEIDIKAAKKQADVVIILMHAGTEYVRTPNSQQKRFAEAVIDYGADLVVGTHPHWAQVIETYQGKTIIYSLGNLVFDQMFSSETRTGLVAKILFKDKTLDKIEYIPIEIKDYGQAEIMPEGANVDKLLKSIGAFN